MKRNKKLGGAEESERGLVVEDSEIVHLPPTEWMQSASSPTRQPVKNKLSKLEINPRDTKLEINPRDTKLENNPRDSINETYEDLHANKFARPA